MKRLSVMLMLGALVASGCDCGAAGLEGRRFGCVVDEECVSGWACHHGECVTTFSAGLDGGTTSLDAGPPPDAGCQPATEQCGDGVDNDCDGDVDCSDSDCLHRPCDPTQPASVCCGKGPNQVQCLNLGTDPKNCGACGASCKGNRTCVPVSAGNVHSGRCTCGEDDDCPSNTPAGQDCEQGGCACTGSNAAEECAAGSRCSEVEGLGSPGFCFY